MFFTLSYKKAETVLGFFVGNDKKCFFTLLCIITFFTINLSVAFASAPYKKPNIVFILSDDQSWMHTSKAGYPYVRTPNFDKIANEGIYFDRAYVTAPSCAPSRVGILSGLYPWQTESGAILYALWPDDLQSFPQLLAANGYKVGFTGKGSHTRRPTSSVRLPPVLGAAFNQIMQEPENKNLSPWDLTKNFDMFLNERSHDQPFMFWVGSIEPHRPYAQHINGYFESVKTKTDFLPLDYPKDLPYLRDDFARYLQEIEIFDKDIGEIIALLEKRELLDNTVIVVTSDNGMPFPKAKAQNYEYGVRVPLAVRWGDGIRKSNRTVHSMISLTDIAPTFLELAGIEIPRKMQGKSLVPLFLTEDVSGIDKNREYVFSAYERHSNWRSDAEPTYPRRVIHTERFTLIRNYFPERWPSGGPPSYGETYRDLLEDDTGRARINEKWTSFIFDKRPYEELYDLESDPFQFNNIIDDPEYITVKQSLQQILDNELAQTDDPVHLTGEDYFAQFPRIESVLDKLIAKEKREIKRKLIPYLLRPEPQEPH